MKAARYSQSLKNRPIPANYANAVQSDLTIEVKAGVKEYRAELKR